MDRRRVKVAKQEKQRVRLGLWKEESRAGAQPPAKLPAQGQDLLREPSRPLLRRLHAALQFSILPGQTPVTELQVLQAAQKVSCGRPGGDKGAVVIARAPASFPRSGSFWWWGDRAVLEKQKQEWDSSALSKLSTRPVCFAYVPTGPQALPRPGQAGENRAGVEEAGRGLRIGTSRVWCLRLRSSPGWLPPQLLGILEGDKRVLGSMVTLNVSVPQGSGLTLPLTSTAPFALGDLLGSQASVTPIIKTPAHHLP